MKGEDNVSARSSFVANAHKQTTVYECYRPTEKAAFWGKKTQSVGDVPPLKYATAFYSYFPFDIFELCTTGMITGDKWVSDRINFANRMIPNNRRPSDETE